MPNCFVKRQPKSPDGHHAPVIPNDGESTTHHKHLWDCEIFLMLASRSPACLAKLGQLQTASLAISKISSASPPALALRFRSQFIYRAHRCRRKKVFDFARPGKRDPNVYQAFQSDLLLPFIVAHGPFFSRAVWWGHGGVFATRFDLGPCRRKALPRSMACRPFWRVSVFA